MKKGKNKARELILSSGFSWLFLLDIARSHKKLKLEPTLEKYIFGIAAQTFNEVLWISCTSLAFIALMFFFDNEPVLIVIMALIFTLVTIILIIYNGLKANLTIPETMRMAYLYIRKIIFVRH